MTRIARAIEKIAPSSRTKGSKVFGIDNLALKGNFTDVRISDIMPEGTIVTGCFLYATRSAGGAIQFIRAEYWVQHGDSRDIEDSRGGRPIVDFGDDAARSRLVVGGVDSKIFMPADLALEGAHNRLALHIRNEGGDEEYSMVQAGIFYRLP